MSATSQARTCYCGKPATAGVATAASIPKCIGCVALSVVEIPGTAEMSAAPPESITTGSAWPAASAVAKDGKLWLHQAEALRQLEAGKNTVIATGTASGKSLIFQLWALHQAATNPESTALVFYPTKALANDQTRRWQEVALIVGLRGEAIGQIDGDVLMNKRDVILEQSRIVIMTPDVCHAWLTRRVAEPTVKGFLRNLRTVIIDEAHTYEAVLGSNSAFLFRRLITATKAVGADNSPQFIAATATILTPEEHLEKLTGQEFSVVEEKQNGSPRHARIVHHVDGEGEEELAALILNIINNDPDAQVIAFHDSRQGVERIVQQTGRRDEIMPYRSGYLSDDRRKIEDSLRENRLRAVVSTSALELGIDMPDLNYGINLYLPPSRKQFHQRLGRIGRSRPGTFVIMAPASEFSRHGDTLAGYCANSVEPSHLYLDNEYIAFQQALCLINELKATGQNTRLPPRHCLWPGGFDAALKNAHGRPPAHLADIASRSVQKLPHLAYSLRDSSEEQMEIIREEQDHSIGSINFASAMREAYPGALYRHRGQSYRAEEWRRNSKTKIPFIRVKPISQSKGRTEPVVRSVVTLNLDTGSIIANRCKVNAAGAVAELKAVITVSVEGFGDESGMTQYYLQLKDLDPRKTRKQRVFPTTAVYIEMSDVGFTGELGEPWQGRHLIVEYLRSQLAYRKSIRLFDIQTGVDNIFMEAGEGFYLADNAIVVYDNVYGGIGLVEDLYQDLPEYALNMSRGAVEGSGDFYSETAERFANWMRRHQESGEGTAPKPGRGNWWRVIKPGSPVTLFSKKRNDMTCGTIEEYSWNEGVRYQVRVEDELIEAADRQLAAAGQDFDWLIWQPETGRRRELGTDYVG